MCKITNCQSVRLGSGRFEYTSADKSHLVTLNRAAFNLELWVIVREGMSQVSGLSALLLQEYHTLPAQPVLQRVYRDLRNGQLLLYG
jgi:hypothetical protein